MAKNNGDDGNSSDDEGGDDKDRQWQGQIQIKNNRNTVTAQWARKVVTQLEAHGIKRDMRPQLPSILILIDEARPGYLYAKYNKYSTREVSEKG